MWYPDGAFEFDDSMPADKRAAVLALYDDHDPTKPAPPIVPQEVTRYQAEVVMRRRGIYSDADALFMALPDDDERKIAWLRAPTVRRDSPNLLYAAQQMGITDSLLDEMFIEADQVL